MNLTVQIRDDFEAILCSPRHCLDQIRKLPLNVRFPWADFECPVTDRNANMVEPCGDGMSI